MEQEIIKFLNKAFTLAMALIIVIAIYLLGNMFYQFSSLPENAPQDFSVSGEAKAYIKPDVAVFSLGVRTEGFKSADVVSENNRKMNAIIEAIKNEGVDEKDIKTTGYNLYPQYDYTEARGRVFAGYVLDQQVTVKVRNFDKISSVLDKATSSGANTVGDLQFTLDNPESARAEARENAIKQAKEKAENIAKSSGLKLLKLVNVSESYGGYPMPLYGMGGAVLEKSDSSIAPDIQPGQQEINVTVYLTYRVK